MAEKSGFFDAHLVDGEYDRIYLAESFAKYFASFIGNGIFGGKSNELMVQQKSTADMSIRVLSGQAYINGYWYENDDELSLAIDVADGVLNRIDLIVLRWDNIERVIRLVVKKGTPASKASAPIIQRDEDYYELKLAQVYIKAGATKITQADITDTRLDNSVCGLVQGVVKQFDTTEFGKQINSFIEQFEATSISEMQAIFNRINSLISDDIATSLALDVDNLKKTFTGIMTESTDYKGCYYKVFEGRIEWWNPPNIHGIEYCTVERRNNKPVYQKTFDVGYLPNKSVMTIEIDAPFDKIISVEGIALDSDNNMSYPFPVILSGITPIAVITGIEGDGGDGSIIVIQTNEDISYMRGYFTVKYTKS